MDSPQRQLEANRTLNEILAAVTSDLPRPETPQHAVTRAA